MAKARKSPTPGDRGADAYAAHRDRMGARSREESANKREIGPPPKVAKPRRRKGCERDFEKFCLTYLAGSFAIRFSDDHRKAIAKIEAAVLEGGLFALAMPRGSGKSTLSEAACLWALLYGHRSFVVLIGAEASKAEAMLDSIKVELETNELLQEDFPEVCHPVAALERMAQRCRGQTCGGEPTYLSWSAGRLVLPTVKGSKASGAVAKTAGFTASIRGLKHKRPDGRSIRPDLVIIDDPQTDESARSASQCEYRKRILSGAVLGLAGPGKKISGIMPCTVIVPGDVADELLDPAKHPQWNGERTKLVYSFPSDEKLWDEYAELRAEGLRRGDGGRAATEFYRKNRAAMDAGAVVAWPERHNPDELSAVQNAMNLRLADPVSFAAEYQNEPVSLEASDLVQLQADRVAERVNRHARGLVPAGCQALTAFADVQQDLLYWAVCGWEAGYTGHVVDYGAWPEQQRPYYRLSEANPTVARATGVSTLEGSLWKALERLAERLLGREWPRDGGGGVRVDRLLIDSGWGQSTEVIYRFCRQSQWGGSLLPSKGAGIGAKNNPMSEWARHPGEQHGHNWVLRPAEKGRPRLLVYDANAWKSFAAGRLTQPLGEPGALCLFGDGPAPHRLFADHLCAEFRVGTEGRGRRVEEWSLRPERPDNHWWDALVGCAVAASTLGVRVLGAGEDAPPAPRPRVSWKEMQQRAKAERQRGR